MAITFSPQRLRKARLRKDWSQADLAYQVRTSEKNIGRWERGENEPRGEAVVSIANATGHDVEFFYTEANCDEDDLEAAMRKQARDLLAPLNENMVSVLLAECSALVVAQRVKA
jgi:transcriptional regulator with XRE-family HTH domain